MSDVLAAPRAHFNESLVKFGYHLTCAMTPDRISRATRSLVGIGINSQQFFCFHLKIIHVNAPRFNMTDSSYIVLRADCEGSRRRFVQRAKLWTFVLCCRALGTVKGGARAHPSLFLANRTCHIDLQRYLERRRRLFTFLAELF